MMIKNERKKLIVKETGLMLGLAALMILIVHLSLGGRYHDFDVYPTLDSDVTSMCMHIRSIQENGWRGMYFNPRIGAPDEAASLVDASGVDVILGLEIFLLDQIFHPSTPRLLYYVLIMTFVTAAWTMAFLLRKMGFEWLQVFVGSALFAAGPYHFYRWLEHLAIGNALTVPLIFFVAFYIIGYKLNTRTKKMNFELFVSALIIGFGCAYFTFFGMIVWAIAVVVKVIIDNEKNIKKMLWNLWPVGVTITGFFITRLPSIFFNIQNGKNTSVYLYTRKPAEQELYGLKIIQLLLPVKYSKNELLSEIAKAYNTTSVLINENVYSGLGLVGSVGFIILCIFLIYSLLKKKGDGSLNGMLFDYMSLTTLSLVLVSSIGGIGEIFNYLVTPMIRCYNRSSILIFCLCIITVLFCLEKIVHKRRDVGRLCLLLVLVLGLIDQTMLPGEDYAHYSDDGQQMLFEPFFEKVEAMDKDDMIYQLPYYDYPEEGPYKPFIGYLFTDEIKWSFGGIAGRDVKAKKLYIDGGMSRRFIVGIKEAGFNRVYIDTSLYKEGSEEVIEFYKKLGAEWIESEDKSLYVFDLSNFRLSEL